MTDLPSNCHRSCFQTQWGTLIGLELLHPASVIAISVMRIPIQSRTDTRLLLSPHGPCHQLREDLGWSQPQLSSDQPKLASIPWIRGRFVVFSDTVMSPRRSVSQIVSRLPWLESALTIANGMASRSMRARHGRYSATKLSSAVDLYA